MTPSSFGSTNPASALETMLTFLPTTVTVTEFALAGLTLPASCYIRVAEVCVITLPQPHACPCCGFPSSPSPVPPSVSQAVGASVSLVAFSLAACRTQEGIACASADVLAVIGKCTHLQRLGIIDCGLTDNAIAALSTRSMLRSGSALRRLVLSDNQVTSAGIDSFVNAIVSQTDGRSRLVDLDLSRNPLGDTGALSLARLMTKDSPLSLEALQMDRCGLHDAGVKGLLEKIPVSSRIRFLDMSGNEFGVSGMFPICRLLRGDTGIQLEELRLTNARIKDDAVVDLFNAICQSSGLQSLDLSGIPLVPRALDACTTMIRSNASVRELKVSIADRISSSHLSKAILINPSLLNVMITGPADAEDVQAINRHLQNNRSYDARGSDGGVSSPNTPFSRRPMTSSVTGTAPPRPPSSGGRSRSGSMISREERLQPEYSHVTAGIRPGRRRGDSVMSDMSMMSEAGMSRGNTATSDNGTGILNRDGTASMASGGASAIAAQVFQEADTDCNGYLDEQELLRVLVKLGMMDGFTQREMTIIARNEYRLACRGSKQLDLSDFRLYYNSMMKNRARELRQEKMREADLVEFPAGYAKHEELKEVFQSFAAFGAGHGRNRVKGAITMDRGQWSKLCRDARFIAPRGPLPGGSVEVIFQKAKRIKTDKSIGFTDFLRALAMVARETKTPFEEVVEALGIEPLPIQKAYVIRKRAESSYGNISPEVSNRRASAIRRQSQMFGTGDLLGDGSEATLNDSASMASTMMRPKESMGGAGFFKGYYKYDKLVNADAAAATHMEMSESGTATHVNSVDNYLSNVAVDNSAALEASKLHARPSQQPKKDVKNIASFWRSKSIGDKKGMQDARQAIQDEKPKEAGILGVLSALKKQQAKRDSPERPSTPPMRSPTSTASMPPPPILPRPGASSSPSTVARPTPTTSKGNPMAKMASMLKSAHASGELETIAASMPTSVSNASPPKMATATTSVDGGGRDDSVVRLEAQVSALASQVARLTSALASNTGGNSGSGGSQKWEKKIENAVLQIASKVDDLDTRMKDEQNNTMKALEAILNASKALNRPAGVRP